MGDDDGASQTPGTAYAYTPTDEPVAPLAPEGISFAALSPDRAGDLARAMGTEVAEIHRREARGARASLALLDEGGVVGYGWVSYDAVRIYELGVYVPLLKGHAYIWDCATLPQYRGRGIFAGLLRFMMERLRLEGRRQVWGGVAPGNLPSQRAFARAGFRLVAETRIINGTVAIRMLPAASPSEAAALRRIDGRVRIGG